MLSGKQAHITNPYRRALLFPTCPVQNVNSLRAQRGCVYDARRTDADTCACVHQCGHCLDQGARAGPGSQHPHSCPGAASECYADSISSLVLSGLSFPRCYIKTG